MRQLDQRNSTVAWLATFGEERSAPGRASSGNDNRTALANTLAGPSNRGLHLVDEPGDWSPALAESERCRIIFDGLLSNRAELQAHFADRLPCDSSDAHLVVQAYHCWGPDAVLRVKGIFALIIWDSARDLLLCARDPLGMHPLFYAEVGHTLLLSPSIETLLRYPGVSAEINRACLIDCLTKRSSKLDETYFTHVSRVPPGHVMRVGRDGRQVYRYWDPVPRGRPIEWIPDDEVQERFEALLGQVVARDLALGPAGIYLSGGLDSGTLALVATDLCQRAGWSAPWALSLAFPGLNCDETAVQRGVATGLGLPQVQLPFDEAAGPEGTLAAALEMSRTLPAPLSLIWRPALNRLALHGQQQGCRVILTGDGADEWLWENSLLAADMLRSLDLLGLYRLCRTCSRSYHFSRSDVLRMLLWRCGTRPLLRDAWRTAAVQVGARRLVRQRRHLAVARAAATPSWIAPDPTLRAQVAQRIHESYPSDEAVPRIDSYYLEDTRSRLNSTEKWFLEEETFLLGQRMGMHFRKPFWDPDLIDFLVKIHPRDRNEGGLAKALVRRPLIQRFPRLGFERQRKSWLGEAFLSVVSTQAQAACQTMGGIRTLGELGVVDPAQVSVLLDDALAGRGPQQWLGWAWLLLNLETWARAHYRPGE